MSISGHLVQFSQRTRQEAPHHVVLRRPAANVGGEELALTSVNSMVGRTAISTVLTLILAAIPALAQTPSANSDVLLDELAGLVNRGKLNVEVDLQTGHASLAPQWMLQVLGTPKATLMAEADEGRVSCLEIDVTGGELIVNGSGLRPRLSIEGFRFEEGKGVTETRFRGRGVWRPLVAVFRILARPALRRLDVPTDIRSILRGQILSAEKSSTPADTEFLDLVREVHINDTEFEAFAGYPLEFGQLVELQTAAHPNQGAPLRAAVDKATFRPPRRGQPAQFEVDGRIDGEIEDGSVAFLGSHCTFARGALEKGAFRVSASPADGQPETSFSAGSLDLDLSSGQVSWPGGPKVGIAAPSHFGIRNLKVRPDGRYSGTVDAALFGKVGSIDRLGTSVAANDVQMHTTGARIVDGKATGDMKLDFQYRLNHTLVVHYPVEELKDRSVPLLFQGTFETQLHFEDAGSGDEGLVNGNYQFTIPWPPIEQAAFEILRARWRQDLPPAIRKVDFVIEPRHFGPCGRDCFLLDLLVTAQKAKRKGYFFQQICNTEGRADLVVDTHSRSLLMRNVRVQPRCQGVIGSIVNFLAPFLTKTYSDVTILQMPNNLPFTIESVGSSANSIFIAGKVDWVMKSTPVATSASK